MGRIFFIRISEIEPKYYADGEDAYAMKRNLVVWSQQQGIAPGIFPLCLVYCIQPLSDCSIGLGKL